MPDGERWWTVAVPPIVLERPRRGRRRRDDTVARDVTRFRVARGKARTIRRGRR